MTQIDAGRDRDGSERYRAPSRTDGQFQPSATSRGSPERAYLTSSGKSLNRHITDLKEPERGRDSAGYRGPDRSGARRDHGRRTGNASPGRRSLVAAAAAIVLGLVAEAVTAFVGMEVLVPSVTLPSGSPRWRP